MSSRTPTDNRAKARSVWVYVAIVLGGAVVWLGWYHNHLRTLELVRESYVRDADRYADSVTHSLSTVFRDMYQALRTAARLPGVREVDRYAADLDSNASSALEALYSNLAENIALSEVYVVPADFDPDTVDPVTGRLQAVTLEYDELISGRTADGDASALGLEVEEVEIIEWRLMREQMRWLREKFPDLESLGDRPHPAIGGPEVITCDNSRYSLARPDDRDRSGLVYSVPVYDLEGVLKGMVSAVILTGALSDLLPANGHFALYNARHEYLVEAAGDGQARRSRAWVKRNQPDPGLVYSRVSALGTIDAGDGWDLWVGFPNRDYTSRPQVSAARWNFTLGSMVIVSAMLGLTAWVWAASREAERLESRIEARTRELSLANRALERSRESERRFTGDAAHELRTPLAALKVDAELASIASTRATRDVALERISEGVDRASALVDKLLALARLDPQAPLGRVSKLDLVEVLDGAVRGLAPMARDRGAELSLEVQPQLTVRGDPDWLTVMMQNLIDNSTRYAGASGRVEIAGIATDAGIEVRVSDTGPGIPEHAVNRVLDRFYRVPGDDGPGSGLGLSIVKRIADLHGVRLRIDRCPRLGGARFRLCFPDAGGD